MMTGIMTQLIACLAVLVSSSFAYCSPGQHDLIAVHDSVGPVIDASENSRFNLFPQDIGFLSGRIFKVSTATWRLQLLGNNAGQPWMVMQRLSDIDIRRLRRRISKVNELLARGKNPELNSPLRKIDLDSAFDPSLAVELKLADGSNLHGHIKSVDSEKIEFTTLGGAVSTLPAAQITAILSPKGELQNGQFVRYDPNNIRLFFGATGRSLRGGEGNISNFYVFFPTVGVGISDNFMVAGGISLLPSSPKQLFYISPKIRLASKKNLDLAAGMVYMGVPGRFDLGAAYTSLSLGNPLGGITLGAAVPFSVGGEMESFVAFMFGAEKQVSGTVKFITENWLFTGGNPSEQSILLLSAGFRFIGNLLTVGLGFVTFEELLHDEGGFPIVPWLDFSLSFGRKL